MKELRTILQRRWPLPPLAARPGPAPAGGAPARPAEPPAPAGPGDAHCRRVAALAAAMGELLRVSHAEVEWLEAAAALHEAGMAALPGELLHGPRPLSDEERERVRAGARRGAELARAAAADPAVALLVERQYADYRELRDEGTLGPRERLLAGILRLADVSDALARPRGDQSSLPPWRRNEILQQGAGTRFHPLAVHAMLRLEGRVEG
jgi:HD-GYP domain-containing protein (c-di-GMP phosphodiesterase class II)